MEHFTKAAASQLTPRAPPPGRWVASGLRSAFGQAGVIRSDGCDLGAAVGPPPPLSLTPADIAATVRAGFQEFNRLADLLQPEDPLEYGGEVLHAV